MLRQIILLLFAATDFAIGLFVFLQNRRSIINRAFFVFTIGTALWTASVASVFLLHNIVWSHFTFLGGIIMYTSLLCFAMVFPGGEPIPRHFWLLCLLAVPITALAFSGAFIKAIRVLPGGAIEPINGPALPIFALALIGYLGYSIILFYRSYRRSTGLARSQIQYFFLGLTVFVVSAVVFDAILPSLGIFRLNLFGPASSVIFFGLTAYAIIRHRLMDIRIVIQFGMIYTSLFAIVIGLYLAAIFILGLLFRETTDISTLLSAGFATIAGIFGVPVIEKHFRKITDKIFFKDKYDYGTALRWLSEILNKSLDEQEIVHQAVAKLKQIFKVADVRIELKKNNDGEEKISSDGIVVPIVLGSKTLGTIIMGSKLSGDPYSEEDFRLLETFGYQAAVAMEKADLFEKVKKHSSELEEKVKERTAQIKGLQEQQKQTMIDISHGLQTPLTIAKGELGFLKREMPANERLVAVERSIDETSKLIYDLLDLMKLETSETDFEKTPVDFSQILRDILEYLGILAEEKNITIVEDIEPGIIVLGNKEKLNELVTNIMSNSFRYMAPDREKKIFVSLRSIGNVGRLVVEDTGIGIGMSDLPHIFTRFYRVQNPGRSEIKGLGLGLAIVKKIVEKHGGTIVAESKLGKGTKFITTIPLENESARFSRE